jgi:heptosyltransferase-2
VGNRILAIRSGALGDTIVALPALEVLRSMASRLEVVGTMPYIDLAPADAVHSSERAMFRAFFDEGAGDRELVGFLRRFDRVVAWSNLPLLSEKARKAGADFIEAFPAPPAGVHASDHLYGVLEPWGVTGPAPWPRVRVSASVGLPETFLAIHPSSGSASKNWAPEHFEAVARLARAAGLDVVWIQGEADASVVPPLARQVGGAIARELPLAELAAVLARCAVFVGNDSGVSHLAAAVDAPTVAVFRSTDPAQWAPRGPRVRVAPAGASPEAVWGFARELMRER